MSGFLKAAAYRMIKSAENYQSSEAFWKLFIWLLAALGIPFMAALEAFGKSAILVTIFAKAILHNNKEIFIFKELRYAKI